MEVESLLGLADERGDVVLTRSNFGREAFAPEAMSRWMSRSAVKVRSISANGGTPRLSLAAGSRWSRRLTFMQETGY